MEQTSKKLEMLGRLRNNEEVFILFSKCTNMPYVYCDPESYNDLVYIYEKETEAQSRAKELTEEKKQPVQVVKLKKEQFLSFYSSLYLMGANALMVNAGAQEEMEIQLEELVRRPDYSNLPKDKVKVENPQLHLTALYFMQTLRRGEKPEITQELKELEEEMLVNLRKGTYVVPVQEDKKVPLMKMKNGDSYQPIFTDVMEFNKFNVKKNFRGAVVPFANLHKILIEQSKGFVINPLGFHLVVVREQVTPIQPKTAS
mgnify:CR=1 FL=1